MISVLGDITEDEQKIYLKGKNELKIDRKINNSLEA